MLWCCRVNRFPVQQIKKKGRGVTRSGVQRFAPLHLSIQFKYQEFDNFSVLTQKPWIIMLSINTKSGTAGRWGVCVQWKLACTMNLDRSRTAHLLFQLRIHCSVPQSTENQEWKSSLALKDPCLPWCDCLLVQHSRELPALAGLECHSWALQEFPFPPGVLCHPRLLTGTGGSDKEWHSKKLCEFGSCLPSSPCTSPTHLPKLITGVS